MRASEYRLYSSLEDGLPLQKWVEIDTQALRSNYRALREHLRTRAPNARLIAVVKADAYGHGAPPCVSALLLEGCDFFAVSCIEEAIPIRRACEALGCNADVLVLGYTSPSLVHLLCENNILQTLLSERYAEELAAAAEERGFCVRVHAAIDTGMNRIGFPAHSEEEILASTKVICLLSMRKGLSIEGMYTHFADADDVEGDGAQTTHLQTERYLHLREHLEACGVCVPFHHISNSAAFALDEAPVLDGVRVGIILYGGHPALHQTLPLSPVMRLKARIIHLHTLLPGECVSYGGEFSAETERKIAVLPIGYADGLLRAYSGATVTVHTKTGDASAPIVGRICMDQCMIDVTDSDADVGDTVTLFGDEFPVQALSKKADTIDYETLCLISARVKRVIC